MQPLRPPSAASALPSPVLQLHCVTHARPLRVRTRSSRPGAQLLISPKFFENTLEVLRLVKGAELVEHCKAVLDDEDAQVAFNDSICLLFVMASTSEQFLSSELGRHFAAQPKDAGRSHHEVRRILSKITTGQRVRRSSSLAHFSRYAVVAEAAAAAQENLSANPVVNFARRTSAKILPLGTAHVVSIDGATDPGALGNQPVKSPPAAGMPAAPRAEAETGKHWRVTDDDNLVETMAAQ
jgi:hypothetical protein